MREERRREGYRGERIHRKHREHQNVSLFYTNQDEIDLVNGLYRGLLFNCSTFFCQKE